MKLVQLYKQVKEESEGPVKILVPRRSKEEREKNFRIAILKKVQEYIKNGSQGDLDLSGTPITSLPDNLIKVGGNLYLENTPITSLPDGLTVGGSLNLDYTPITSLPKNLTVGGNLWLKHSKLTSLSSNLSVGLSLDLENTFITSLPKDLKVGMWVDLTNTPISKQYTKEEIKQMAPGVKGEIYIIKMNITEIKNIVKKVISEVTNNTPPLDMNSITFEDLKKIGADTLPSLVNSTTQMGIKSEKDLDNYKKIFIKKFGNATLNLDKDQPWYAKVTITGNQKFDEFRNIGNKAADKFYTDLKFKND